MIAVGDASGNQGSVVGFAVSIDTAGQEIASASLCIGFDLFTPIDAIDGAPDCDVPVELGKIGQFAFQPNGCTPGDDCNGACADVGGSLTPIASGATLFACRVAIAEDAPLGEYPLTCSAPVANNPDGFPRDVGCTDGVVIVQNRIPGDCNGDGVVMINEIITGVNISLEILPLTACPAFDTNRDGRVTIEELIAAVNAALTGPG
jgi:hypothetical protein